MKENCLVLALDARSGEPRWNRTFPASTTCASDYMVSRAAPTPVVDHNGLYVFFEGGDLIGLSHRGEVKWQRSLTKEYGEFENHHGVGSSLAQTEQAVVVLIDHRGPSYLLAVDKATGENLWKVERESRMSWTSPIVVQMQGKEQVVVSSNGTVDGYDAATGKLLWTLDDIGGNSIPSASVSGNRLFIGASLSRFNPVPNAAESNCCLQVREAGGEFTCGVLWRAEKVLAHYASPLPYRRCVYYVNKVGAVFCLDIETGARNYVERIDGPCWATPVAVGDHVFFFGKDGVTTVVKAGPTFAKVATNGLWDPDNPPKAEQYVAVDKAEVDKTVQPSRSGRGVRSRRDGSRERYQDPIVYGVAVIDDSFFIRTGTRLYCVRKS